MTEQIHNGTNLNVITHDYIMKTTEYTEFVHCFTKTRWTNNVTQTIIPRTFEVDFTGSSDGDEGASSFILSHRLSGAKLLTLKTGQSSIDDCTTQVHFTY